MTKTTKPVVSQKDRLVARLSRKTRNTVTARTAARELGIRNLRARISELRNDEGYVINTDFRVNRDGTTEAVYSMATV